jgi:predicted nuclease with TOPRIM domain
MYCPGLKTISEFGEEEREFRIRLQHLAHEKRDDDLEAMKMKYASKIQTLENRLQKAEQTVEKQSTKASQKKMDAVVSAGSAIFGAFFGRKSISATSMSRIGTAVKSTTRALKSGEGIDQAQELLESINLQLEELQTELEGQLTEINTKYDVLKEELEEIDIRAISENITVHLVGLAWEPISN